MLVYFQFFARKQSSPAQTSCLANLRLIDGAKATIENEKNMMKGAVVTKDQLLPYLPFGWPVCPKGGEYSIGKIGDSPKCSDPEHSHYQVPPD